MQRKYAYRRKLPHYQWIDKTYFITFATRNRETLPPHARDLILETCLIGNGKRYELDVIVVMPDHVHLILTPLEDKRGPISLPEILQEIKSISAHRINKYLGRRGNLWQQESFDRAMRQAENTLGKLEYVLGNPVRAGLVTNPYDYRWLWTRAARARAPVPPKFLLHYAKFVPRVLQIRTETAPNSHRDYGGAGALARALAHLPLSLTSFSASPSLRPHQSATIPQSDSSISQIVDCELCSTHARRAARRQTGSRTLPGPN
jgi:putative transposase